MKFKLVLLFAVCFHLTADAQILRYTDGKNGWNPDSLGNHRVVVLFNGPGKVAHVKVNWRRRDEHPELKRLIIQDADGKSAALLGVENFNRESADIYFEAPGKGRYFIYYLPYKNEGRSNYPKGVYLKANSAPLEKTNKVAPNASALEIQSIDAFNSFYPMEVIATAMETRSLRAKHKTDDFIVFPEDRRFPIKMQNDLPYRWIEKGISSSFAGSAAKGEHYAFQLGVYALKELNDLKVTFGDLKSSAGKTISTKYINCLNTNGTSYDNKPLVNKINVAAGTVQAMWITVDVP
ncbi:MAG: hypothetical protein EOO98_14395, partial [Pedobacter sp.]